MEAGQLHLGSATGPVLRLRGPAMDCGAEEAEIRRALEPLAGIRRAAAVVITRADSERDVAAVRARLQTMLRGNPVQAEVVFRPDEAVSVTTGVRHGADWCVGKKAWLVSGIGNSDSFRRLAMANGV